ncbi:hypothetical protein Hypma_013674 [Hypsizygus marmoreus]|uniref:DUF6699 domain-containing protein n=1 Tax=Hypsizygus marmoreus TaxID=39966 RepID=A0A369JB74_HYPMA|nr:hypothetical protein Hypma_013674 [Hypsizygus marmoreus]
MGDNVGKWAAGGSYGPVLSQTELYLLQTDLELHPILLGKHPSFTLAFSVQSGNASGFNSDSRDRELPFAAKDEPATLPRVSQLYIITPQSPWCTVVKNEKGVTMNDICQAVWKDYAENYVTDTEFASVSPRLQEHIKRMATNNLMNANGQWGYYTPQPPQVNRFKRVDWLRERIFFESLRRHDSYAVQRLGFKAPNIFVMDLSN